MIPPGPIITLVYRVAPEKRSDLLAFLRDAIPFYERPGGIRVALFESLDDPGLLLELVAYAGEREFAEDQERVEHDPGYIETLARWRSLLDSSIEVRRMRPVAV
jgi:hypothetical protein